ncbi:YolD-like family protein [Bacillus pumilus]
MLPEHVTQLNHDLAETKKIDKPIIDERQAEEFELTIAYAMSVNNPLSFQFLINVCIQPAAPKHRKKHQRYSLIV